MNTMTQKTEGRPIKKNGYSSATLHAKRDAKRREAEARQREFDKLPPTEKANRRRGNLARKAAKLEAAKRKAAK